MSFALDPQVAEALAPGAAAMADPPPAHIEVGRLDLFRDEDLTYALRLSQAGVPVEFHLHPGVPHEFEGIAHASDIARRVMADRIRVLSAL
ncbi:alpha/beta hydrolase family protein [Actinocorallia herbida]|uniref:Alpha/beta hydrolase family protein n=1 Tax=Actinocorallia herbida TaxID=58109 RepID=A0A3N1D199_9ACTN|nr:alpha/beta hydrolase fold domain-containing protein [Actinocorallia herbida]ROO87294.1 alpha/beta hydrolase family protein [Actinocorallia herbida]